MKRIALITGGTRGIGLGIAIQLAKQGFNLAVNGTREPEAVKATIDELKALSVDVIYCRGSIASSADRQQMIDSIKEHYGMLHVLVNNAGMAPRQRKDILETTEESFDEVMSVNLKGCYFLTQLASYWMFEQKIADASFYGYIINIGSISATVASVNRGEYCLSKAGISMTTQLFAVRLGEFNIPVYEVRPGIIRTDMTAGVKEKYDKMISEGLCIQQRWGEPEDVGKVVAALAKGDFMYSTGQVIMVDGGMTIPRL